VRSVFLVGPDKKIKAMLTYPMTTGRNFDEVVRILDSVQLTAKHQVATPGQLEARRRRLIRRIGVGRRGEKALPAGLAGAAALSALRPAAALTTERPKSIAAGVYRGRAYRGRAPGLPMPGARPRRPGGATPGTIPVAGASGEIVDCIASGELAPGRVQVAIAVEGAAGVAGTPA